MVALNYGHSPRQHETEEWHGCNEGFFVLSPVGLMAAVAVKLSSWLLGWDGEGMGRRWRLP